MKADAMRVSAFQRSRRSLKLLREFNTPQFASVMGVLVFVVLAAFMTAPTPHGGIGIDVPWALHPVSMPGATCEHVIKIAITRDGKIFVGPDPLYDPADLPNEIKDRLKDADVEHKVYIKADARARWGTVKQVLQGVHDAGIIRVAVLAEQRRLH